MIHYITVDEAEVRGEGSGDPAAKAFCSDECGWSGEWHHASDFAKGHDNASGDLLIEDGGITAAFDAAAAEGDDHLAGVALDEPTPGPKFIEQWRELNRLRTVAEQKKVALRIQLDAIDRLLQKNADGHPLTVDDWTEMENLRV